MTATLSHADRVAAAKRADDQYLRRVTELCAQFKGATSDAQAARVGEELLRVHVHRYQEIRAWVRAEQRNDPAAAAEWLAPRGVHLMFVARAETYLLHALSNLPDDEAARLAAVKAHLLAIGEMLAEGARADERSSA